MASKGKGAAVGIGLTAAAVAAVGTYFLYGSKRAPANRARARSWMLKAKADVLEAIESAKRMDRSDYEKIVDDVAKRYSATKKVSRAEVKAFADELKTHWKAIEKASKTGKPVKSALAD